MVSLSRIDTSIVTSGGQQRLLVADEDSQGVLARILTTLQLMNIYLSTITDEQLDETDIPVEVR